MSPADASLSLFDALDHLLFTAAVGLARITPALFFLPYLKPKVIGGGFLRRTSLLVVALGLAPIYLVDYRQIEAMWVAVLIQEIIIGFLIGFALGLPFWVAMAIGEFLDNQRGATISSAMDPAVGVKASPLASFFNLFWAAAFASGGGLLLVLEVLAQSYRLFPVTAGFNLDRSLVAGAASLLTRAIAKGTILAAPMVIAMYLTELALGLLSRFASQLNPFSMAMTLKSMVMLCVMLIYFGPHIPATLFGLFDGTELLVLLEKRVDGGKN